MKKSYVIATRPGADGLFLVAADSKRLADAVVVDSVVSISHKTGIQCASGDVYRGHLDCSVVKIASAPYGFVEVINVRAFSGAIPAGRDLVVFEEGRPDTALALYGFDEVGLFDATFKKPVYGLMPATKLPDSVAL